MCNSESSESELFAPFIPVVSHVLNSIALKNKQATGPEEMRLFSRSRLPPISIEDYIKRIVQYAYCSPECFVIALIYVDRIMTKNTDCKITPFNIHRLIITSVLLAAKSRDDTYYSNSYYAAVGGITTEELNQLERAFLTLIEFDLFVKPETYTRYLSDMKTNATAFDMRDAPERS
jgi:hypothetical protein